MPLYISFFGILMFSGFLSFYMPKSLFALFTDQSPWIACFPKQDQPPGIVSFSKTRTAA